MQVKELTKSSANGGVMASAPCNPKVEIKHSIGIHRKGAAYVSGKSNKYSLMEDMYEDLWTFYKLMIEVIDAGVLQYDEAFEYIGLWLMNRGCNSEGMLGYEEEICIDSTIKKRVTDSQEELRDECYPGFKEQLMYVRDRHDMLYECFVFFQLINGYNRDGSWHVETVNYSDQTPSN